MCSGARSAADKHRDGGVGDDLLRLGRVLEAELAVGARASIVSQGTPDALAVASTEASTSLTATRLLSRSLSNMSEGMVGATKLLNGVVTVTPVTLAPISLASATP